MSRHMNDLQLSGYLENTLPVQEKQEADAHLHECSACASRLEQMRGMIRILRETPDEEPPEGLKARILTAIAGEAARVEAKRFRISRNLQRWTAAAAAVVVLCGTLTLGLGGGPARIGEGVSGVETDSQDTVPQMLTERFEAPAADMAAPMEPETEAWYDDGIVADMEMPEEEPIPEPEYAVRGEESVSEEAGGPRSGSPDTLELQKIVYTACCTQTTYNFAEDRSSLLTKTHALGGFVQYNTTSGVSFAEGGSGLYGDLTLRVPQKAYAEMMTYVSQLGTQEYMEESAENIGQVYADESIRLQNLEAQHAALLELMDQAENLEDIILLRGELNDIATRIEQSQSSLRNMDQQIAYATINVTIRELRPTDVIPAPRAELTLGERIREALYGNLAAIRDGFQGFLVGFLGAAPYLAILALVAAIVLVVVQIVRRGTARRKK